MMVGYLIPVFWLVLFTPGLTFSDTWLCHASVLVTPGLTLKDDCMVIDETV